MFKILKFLEKVLPTISFIKINLDASIVFLLICSKFS